MGYYLNSIYSCNLSGGLVILGAWLFSALSTDHLHDIRLYALYFRRYLILASHMNNSDQAF